MSWAKLDDKFHSHPKVLATLTRGAKGLAALGLWALALSWCGAYQTPEVPSALVSQMAPGKRGQTTAALLVEAGLWVRTNDGYQVHDWAEYQPANQQTQRADEPQTNEVRSTNDHKRDLVRERVARWRENQRTGNAQCNAHETPKKLDVTHPVTLSVTPDVTLGNAPCNAHVTHPVTHPSVTSLDENELAILVNTRARAPRPEPVPSLPKPIFQIPTAAAARVHARESMPEVQDKPAEPPPPAEPVAPSVDSEAKAAPAAPPNRPPTPPIVSPPPAPPSEPTPPPESTERPIVAPKPSAPAQNPNQPSTPPQSATQRIEAVLAECSALAPLNRGQLASLLEGRRMASGKPVAWVEQAIRDADRSAATSALGGEPLSNSRLADLVVRYCDHARAPKRTESILSLKEQSNRIDSVIKMINPLMQHEQRIGTNLRVRHPTHPFQPPPQNQTERTGLCNSLTNLLHTCLALTSVHTAAITQATHSNAYASSAYTNRVVNFLPRDSNKLVPPYP